MKKCGYICNVHYKTTTFLAVLFFYGYLHLHIISASVGK